MDIVVLVLVGIVTILLYFTVRNSWVFRVRARMIHADYSAYKRLPKYEYMLYCRPFTWRVEKFLPPVETKTSGDDSR